MANLRDANEDGFSIRKFVFGQNGVKIESTTSGDDKGLNLRGGAMVCW